MAIAALTSSGWAKNSLARPSNSARRVGRDAVSRDPEEAEVAAGRVDPAGDGQLVPTGGQQVAHIDQRQRSHGTSR